MKIPGSGPARPVVEPKNPLVRAARRVAALKGRDPGGRFFLGVEQAVIIGFEVFDERGLHLKAANGEIHIGAAVLNIRTLSPADLDRVLQGAKPDDSGKDNGQGDPGVSSGGNRRAPAIQAFSRRNRSAAAYLSPKIAA